MEQATSFLCGLLDWLIDSFIFHASSCAIKSSTLLALYTRPASTSSKACCIPFFRCRFIDHPIFFLYTRLKNEIICASVHTLIIRYLTENYPCTFPTLEAKTCAFGVVNMAFTGNKQSLYYTKRHIFLHFPPINQILTRIMHGYDTDNFRLSI